MNMPIAYSDDENDAEIRFGKLTLEEIKNHLIMGNHHGNIRSLNGTSSTTQDESFKLIETHSEPNLRSTTEKISNYNESILSNDSFTKFETMVDKLNLSPKNSDNTELNNTLENINYILSNGPTQNVSKIKIEKNDTELYKDKQNGNSFTENNPPDNELKSTQFSPKHLQLWNTHDKHIPAVEIHPTQKKSRIMIKKNYTEVDKDKQKDIDFTENNSCENEPLIKFSPKLWTADDKHVPAVKIHPIQNKSKIMNNKIYIEVDNDKQNDIDFTENNLCENETLIKFSPKLWTADDKHMPAVEVHPTQNKSKIMIEKIDTEVDKDKKKNIDFTENSSCINETLIKLSPKLWTADDKHIPAVEIQPTQNTCRIKIYTEVDKDKQKDIDVTENSLCEKETLINFSPKLLIAGDKHIPAVGIQQPLQSQKQVHNKTPQKRILNLNKSQTTVFKTPSNPLHLKKPSTTSVRKTTGKINTYQHISSPIATYIKRSPQVHLVQDVHPKKPLPSTSFIPKLVKNQFESKQNKENIKLPSVAYKSAKKTKVINLPEQEKLPQSPWVKKLASSLPKATVLKHERREMNIKKHPQSEKEESFTNLSLHQAEVSICTNKPAFKNNK